MSFKALVYAYVLGGLTFIPLVIAAACFYAIYTSVPVGDPDADKFTRGKLERESEEAQDEKTEEPAPTITSAPPAEVNDLPRTRKGWLTVRRTFEETATDASYVGLVKGFSDARSKDPKRSRPKDMWYVALKGKVLYLYEDESMTECEAAIELGSHEVVIYPEGLLDGELFAKRNAVCLKPKLPPQDAAQSSITKEMVTTPDFENKVIQKGGNPKQKQRDKERAQELEKKHEESRQEALDPATPWFIFVRSNVEMEDWYLALVHASENPPNTATLSPLQAVFQPSDMLHLVETLDEQPDVIPMRWLNALIGRVFFSYYRTQHLESYIIGRLMRKLSKIKRPSFLTDVSVREVSVGNRAPTFSKPMLKELTKEGDASMEVHLHYKGEVRITVDATATINLGARFKSYTVKLVLAAVLREIEGNLLIKVKRPPSNRIWYAFTQMPRMVLDVEPVVSDRQITWSMILSTIESRLKEVIQESVVLPNMDDIAFFESSKYSHRGGIWADASRHERSSDLFPSPSEASDDERATSSAPVSDASTPVATDVEPAEIQRSHSAPLEAHVHVESPSESLPTSIPMSRTTTVSTASTSSTASSRRRTWFGGSRDEENASTSHGSNLEPADAIERGRSGAPESAATRRSSSISDASHHSLRPDTQVLSDDAGSSWDEHSTATGPSTRRSSSQHSSSTSSHEAPSQDTPIPGTSTSPAESLLAGFRSKSPGGASTQSTSGSHSNTKNTPASPTSNFFQTLKSRDKQAISNSAKEAMRKWGVNWGSLRKDGSQVPGGAGSGGANTSGDEAADGEMRGRENEPNVHRPRPSYAEVRAAVEQRRTHNHEGGLFLAPGSEPSSSEPVNIPYARGKGRTASVSDTLMAGLASTSGQSAGNDNDSPASTSPRPDRLTPESTSRPRSTSPSSLTPSLGPRQRTTSHHSQPGTDPVPEEDEQPARQIYTQPPAPKAMTIPGIHASHRGEVMSMGYAPPPPPSAEQKKAPAIQSVYRLWKNPNAPAAGQTASAAEPQLQTDTAVREREHEAEGSASGSGLATNNSAAGSSSQTPTPTPAAKPVPPPLPPRSNSTHAVQVLSEPPLHPPEMSSSSPPASAALQSIVSKDRTRRESLEKASLPPSTSTLSTSSSSNSTGRPVPPIPTASTNASSNADIAAVTTDSVPSTPPLTAAVSGEAPSKPKPPALPPRRTPAAAA